MKQLLAAMVALTVITFCSASEAQAQGFVGGYQFGSGINANCGLGFALNHFQREQPPYFAKFPPVYYSHIVKRPYGVSPFAAPAGIAPVEMNHVAPKIEPVTKLNPFYRPEAKQASEEKERPELKDKVTWTINPFYSNVRSDVASK